ncbi:RNA polymerase sigma-70 factor (ECF subfamily) [Ilumatobacter fluminis]|uniref:RNA polymerase sigma-70 factor (ECF subfamily) n=1 Tax=Ilumatobacter fluminis TaxID=467091 RepID=A0A4R7I674_9ACTN|nr:RNA polymerase sigma factor [Ilumatobacter fluminis]TDT18529.1 RNA polymerase sigma-70 factor (ECF subfamily) [Ilumatobacter fluminis]
MTAGGWTDVDDPALVTRALDRDDAAFGELLRRHRGAALRVAAVITGSTDDAPDVVQEAFVRAHGRLGTFRGESSARSWLLRVVANEAKNHVRGRTRRRRHEDRHFRLGLRSTDTAEPTDVAAERRLEHERVAAALGRLGRRDREVLGCRFLAGLTEAETADVLGVPVGTVKSRTSRALDRMARELEEQGR